MNPNKVNHFSSAAVGVTRSRSRFHRPSRHLTTFNSGYLIPLYVDEVLPGDNIEISINALCRMSTPIHPVMDNAHLDVYAFYVPNRLVYDKWKELMGENNTDYWTQDEEFTVPQISYTSGMREISSTPLDVLNYMGVPGINGSGIGKVSALPVRAYVKIWNDWFRDQNTQTPAHLYTDGNDRGYDWKAQVGDYYISTAELGGDLLPVNKFKDYFTSALPGAQKGNPVQLSLGTLAPVVTGDKFTVPSTAEPLTWSPLNGGSLPSAGATLNTWGAGDSTYAKSNSDGSTGSYVDVAPSNLYANLAEATSATVNQLRLAFQTQKYLETLARSGSRYVESLYALYGVHASDRSLQRSEYLGGCRVNIGMTSVAQTSSTDSATPQGNLAAYSVTGLQKKLSNHFFEEHGFLILVGCVRVDQTYSQGVEKFWFRKSRFDFYAPVFAHLGEQKVTNGEIFYQGTAVDNEVFGYQEAWAEYRYKKSLCTAKMNPCDEDTLSAWHYGNKFDNLPVLTAGFLKENPALIDRTLAVSSSLEPQFLLDLYIDNYSTRVMPMYSVPGLIDHA